MEIIHHFLSKENQSITMIDILKLQLDITDPNKFSVSSWKKLKIEPQDIEIDGVHDYIVMKN